MWPVYGPKMGLKFTVVGFTPIPYMSKCELIILVFRKNRLSTNVNIHALQMADKYIDTYAAMIHKQLFQDLLSAIASTRSIEFN